MDIDTEIELKRVLLKTCSTELTEELINKSKEFYPYLFALYLQPFEANRVKQKQTFVIKATRRYILDRLTSCIKPKKVRTDELEFLIHPDAPKYKKIYEPILKPDFITYLQTHLGKLSNITEGIYDYTTFESTFAKEFNIPKRSLKKYLEPSYDYQISDFAKGVTNVYIRTKYPPKNIH